MKCTAVAQQRSNGRECSEHCECCRLPLDPGLIQLPKEEQLATPIPKVVLRDCVQEREHRSYTEMVSDSIQDSILDGTNIVTSGSRRETYIYNIMIIVSKRDFMRFIFRSWSIEFLLRDAGVHCHWALQYFLAAFELVQVEAGPVQDGEGNM